MQGILYEVHNKLSAKATNRRPLQSLCCFVTEHTPSEHPLTIHTARTLKRQAVVGIIFPLENWLGTCYVKLNIKVKGEKELWRKEGNKTSSCCYRAMHFLVLFWIILHGSPQMPRQIWKVFLINQSWPEYFPQKRKRVW